MHLPLSGCRVHTFPPPPSAASAPPGSCHSHLCVCVCYLCCRCHCCNFTLSSEKKVKRISRKTSRRKKNNLKTYAHAPECGRKIMLRRKEKKNNTEATTGNTGDLINKRVKRVDSQRQLPKIARKIG